MTEDLSDFEIKILQHLYRLSLNDSGTFTARYVANWAKFEGYKRVENALDHLVEIGFARGYYEGDFEDVLIYALNRVAYQFIENADGQDGPQAVPASDRVVSLTDNQISEIDDAAAALEIRLSAENSIDGDLELRTRFVAQIKAARELLQAKSVRAYLMYETVVRMLVTLIEKYKDHVIGELSKKLLDHVLEHIVGK